MYRDEPVISFGDVIYNDSECTIPKSDGANLWWYITNPYGSISKAIQINSSGEITNIVNCTGKPANATPGID